MSIQVAILAGGLATRLGRLSNNQPKSLIEIDGKPFLEYQIEYLKNGGINDFVLCTGYMGDKIQNHFGNGTKYGVSIQYSLEEKPLGTAGALKKAESLLDDTFFTLYGDSYIFLDFKHVWSYYKTQKKPALMTVYKNDLYEKSNVEIEGNLVKNFSKTENTDDMQYVEYGANVFSKNVLKTLPENEFYPLERLFSNLVEMGELLVYIADRRYYEVGSLHGIGEFERYIRSSN
ncbi:sugar phosphate nucleotidyltransferase [Chloroflexota bacterium]